MKKKAVAPRAKSKRPTLSTLRAAIDRIDARLAKALGDRATLVRHIGAWKRKRGLPAIDVAREQEIVARAVRRTRGFSRQQMERIVAAILRESRRLVK